MLSFINTHPQSLFQQGQNYLQKNSSYDLNEIQALVNWLLEYYFQLNRPRILANQSLDIQEDKLKKYNLALQRLAKNEPIQYILGETEFYGRKFFVNPSVLIPRPETEELVEWICQDYKSHLQTFNMLDIGTGSGCISVNLALELPHSQVFALDISKDALAVAHNNARLNQASINFIEGDILQNPRFEFTFTVIVSNPPYVRETEKKEMQANVLDFEPHLALFVEDEKPLMFYEAIARFAQAHLIEGGSLYVEINEALGQDTVQLFEKQGFINTQLKRDLRGKARMVKATKAEYSPN
jgi:release factor glutamine methyltransferase